MVAILAASVACAGSPPRPEAPTVTRHGPCDASAAVAIGPHSFIVASDEDNVLRVYGPGDAQPQPGAFDLSAFLGLEADGQEADIEGATRIGDVIYCVTSHGADKHGGRRPVAGWHRDDLLLGVCPASRTAQACAMRPPLNTESRATASDP